MKSKNPKILFCIENYKHGGIPKALESLLSLMDENRFDAELFCINQEDGPYKSKLHKYTVNKQNRLLWAFSTYLSEYKGLKKYLLFGIKGLRKFLIRTIRVDLFFWLLNREAQKISSADYDAVVAYAEGTITRFVSQIEATNRIAWIHMDYKRNLEYIDRMDESNIYSRFHRIVIPSNFSRGSFVDVFPDFADRTVTIPNLLDETYIQEASRDDRKLDTRFSFDGFTILSVGRICYEKRFFEIPRIASRIKSRGCNVKWYIVGGGSAAETALLQQNIRHEEVEDTVIPLGAKDNPYPYIQHSDLVACTSISETFSYVIGEAKVLGVPVVSTNFGTAKEVLNDRYGIITELEEMADAIAGLVLDPSSYDCLKRNLQNYRYDNDKILAKVYSLFEEHV